MRALPSRTTREAVRLKALDDLLLCTEEQVELIGGEILRRPVTQ